MHAHSIAHHLPLLLCLSARISASGIDESVTWDDDDAYANAAAASVEESSSGPSSASTVAISKEDIDEIIRGSASESRALIFQNAPGRDRHYCSICNLRVSSTQRCRGKT